jgi:hypothetical protein
VQAGRTAGVRVYTAYVRNNTSVCRVSAAPCVPHKRIHATHLYAAAPILLLSSPTSVMRARPCCLCGTLPTCACARSGLPAVPPHVKCPARRSGARLLHTLTAHRRPAAPTARRSFGPAATLQYHACECASYCGQAMPVRSVRPPSITGTPSSRASLTARPCNSSACRRPRWLWPRRPVMLDLIHQGLVPGPRAPLRHLGLPAP